MQKVKKKELIVIIIPAKRRQLPDIEPSPKGDYFFLCLPIGLRFCQNRHA